MNHQKFIELERQVTYGSDTPVTAHGGYRRSAGRPAGQSHLGGRRERGFQRPSGHHMMRRCYPTDFHLKKHHQTVIHHLFEFLQRYNKIAPREIEQKEGRAMASKKRVTLTKNFKELVETGDIEQLKGIYDLCELSAVYDGRYGMNTALHYHGVPNELVRWLVAQGLDVDIENYYGCSPLYAQSTGRGDTVKLLLELGADMEKPNRYGERPLHAAASFFRADTVRLLVEQGANIHVENQRKQTPLESSLAVCRNGDIANMAKIAGILLEAGANITWDMKKYVERIGKEFEFHRENFNKNYLSEADAGLQTLYGLFDVAPIAKRQIHDGVSPIIVSNGPWEKQYETLWQYLVPSSGPAQTVQGEVIRVTGRIRDELYRNGGANWNQNHRNMLNALFAYFASGTPLSECELQETKQLTSSIHAKGSDNSPITDRLCELAVLWVLKNPNPVLLKKPNDAP